MLKNRRSVLRSIGGFAALVPFAPAALAQGPVARPVEAAAPQPGLSVLADLAERLRSAALSLPSADARAKAAVAGTLARLEVFAAEGECGRLILANIAAAEVVAFQDGREALRSRAIVGAGRTRTPCLASVVPSVRLNPPWYVPASIAPTIDASSGLFRRVNGTFVQPPGPRNPLGPIRIGLEDSQSVFLHGTSDPRLFARERRTLSHGCVRVERILDLAAWVLGTAPEALAAAVATGRTRELVPPEEVRVALAYLTAWPADDGRLVLHPDPYGLDRLPDRGARRVAPRPALRRTEPAPVQAAAPDERA